MRPGSYGGGGGAGAVDNRGVNELIDGNEVFVDSINSPPELFRFLKTHDVSTNMFPIVHYSQDLRQRRALSDRARETAFRESPHAFRERWRRSYHFYSYESVPASKLLNLLGWDARVMNLSRPPRWLSGLAERPNLMLATGFTVAALCGNIGVLAILAVVRRRRVHHRSHRRRRCARAPR